MSRSKMTWVAGAAAAALVLAGCGSSDAGSSTASDKIIFGMVTDTSGGASAYAPYTGGGIELAIQELNKAGGINGKQIELITESDGSDTTQTPTITRRLVEKGAQVILLNSGSASAIATKNVCVEEKVLCVAPGNLSADIIAPPGNEFIYILGPTSAGIGESFAKGMTKAGYKKLAVIADDVPTIQGYVPKLVGAITEAGVEQVALEKVAADASDVSAQVARIKAADPDVILVMSLGGQTEALVQNALFAQLPDVQRFSLASIGNQPTTWKLADKGALEGVVFAGSIDASNERTTTFKAALAAKGGDFSALTAYGAQGYDGTMLVAQAVKGAGEGAARSAINDAFQKLSGYQAHYGQPSFTLSFGTDKHVGSDGNCGLVLAQFNADNEPGAPWPVFQPSC